ncbi:MAG: phosphatase PAP2 family protein [Fimbriimonas sp.]
MRRYFQHWIINLRSRQAAGLLMVMAASFLVLSFGIHQPGVSKVDLRVTNALQSIQWPGIETLMVGFTFLGNSPTLCFVGIGSAAWMWWRGHRLAGILTVVTLLGLPLNMLIKEWIGRPRPDGSLVSVVLPTIGLSFPSGHAMASTMLYGFLAALTWMHVRSPSRRLRAAGGFVATAVMVSLSRVYLGAHWISDVVGGWTAGLVCLVILVEIYRFKRPPSEDTTG